MAGFGDGAAAEYGIAAEVGIAGVGECLFVGGEVGIAEAVFARAAVVPG